MDRSAEDELLLCCLGAAGERAGPGWTELSAGADWDRVIEAAMRHGVAPLLHKRISAREARPALPAAARRRLREIYLRSGARNLRLFHDLSGILAALGSDGVPVIVLKGAYLAATVYGDIAERQMGDLDLLVRKHHLPKAEAALRRVGCALQQRGERDRHWYASRHFHLRYRANSGTSVEIHWDLALPSAPSRLGIAGVWERAQPARIADVEALGLSGEDLILYLCLHASRHKYAWGLKPLCDVAAVLSHFSDRIDWETFLRHVDDSRIDPAACWALLLARDMLRAKVPSHVLARLKLDALEPEFVGTLQGYILGGTPAPGSEQSRWEALGPLRRAQGLRKRASALFRSLFPPVEYLRYVHDLPPGTARAYVYYLIRPFHLARRWGRDVLAWAFRTRRARRGLDRARAGDTILRAMAAERPAAEPEHSVSGRPGRARP